MNEFLVSRNPINQEVIRSVLITNINKIDDIVKRSKIAQKKWEKLSVDERIQYLVQASEQLIPEIKQLAVLLSKEWGKTKL